MYKYTTYYIYSERYTYQMDMINYKVIYNFVGDDDTECTNLAS